MKESRGTKWSVSLLSNSLPHYLFLQVCRDLKCTHTKCNFYGVEKKASIVVEVSGRLANESLVEEGNSGGDVSSLALARAIHKKFSQQGKALAVTTHVNAIQLEGGQPLPWWIYLLAILIGLLILALLILLLWRVSFPSILPS